MLPALLMKRSDFVDVILTAAVTANGMIARHAAKPVDWSADLALFRKQTMGHTVVLGSNTEALLRRDLDGRKIIAMHREMDPVEVLAQVKTELCFIIGGARTYSRFAPHLTHLYVTMHPLVFRSGAIPLFSHLELDLKLTFKKKITVMEKEGIYQFQYMSDPVY